MRLRRAAAVLVSSVLVAAAASLPGPASAQETPRLLGVTIAVDTGQVPTIVTTTFRFAGVVGGVDPTWAHTFADGHVQTVSSGGYGVNPGLSQYDLSFAVKPYYAQGLWTLRSVRVTSPDGSNLQTFGVGSPTPIPGGAPTFTLASGPTSLTDIAATGATVTSAVLAAPSVDPKTVDGATGSIRTDLGYAAPGADASFQPVFRLVGTDIYRGPAGFGVATTSGTVLATMAASQLKWGQGAAWRFDRILVRSGPVTRIYYAGGTVTTTVQTHFQLNNSPDDCTGYLGEMSIIAANPACITVSSAAHTLTDLGAPASVFAVTGLLPPPVGPPQLTNATVSTKSVPIGGTVTYSATYTDAAALPTTGTELALEGRVGTVSLTKVSSTKTGCSVSAPYTCTVSVTYQVPSHALPGTYVIAGLYTTNAQGSTAYYTPTDVKSTWWGPSVTSALGATSPHVATLGFTVTGTSSVDTVPPVLTGFARTSAGVVDGTNPGGDPTSATWHWTGTDTGGSGVVGVQVDLLSPTLNYEQTAHWDAPGNIPVTSGDVVFNSFQVSDWIVRYVTIIDAAGNRRRFDADGQIVPGTTRHTLDLSSASITILDGAAPSGVPSPPRALKASGRDQTLVVTWSAPAVAGSSAVTSYDVTLQPGGAPLTVSGTTATITGLSNEWGYAITVRAKNSAGAGPAAWIPGTWVHKVAPIAAPGIGAVAPILRSTKVSFSGTVPAAQAGAPVTGYRTQVRRAVVGVRLPAAWSSYGAVRAAPAGSVTPIKPGERVCVRVVAVNTVGVGAGSAARCTVALADDRSLAAATKGWSRVTLSGAYLKTATTSRTLGARLLSGPAYGTAINLAVRTVPGGGTVGVYVGSKLVATWSLASSKATFVTKTIVTPLAGQRVTVKVLKVGKAGVVIDGWAVRA